MHTQKQTSAQARRLNFQLRTAETKRKQADQEINRLQKMLHRLQRLEKKE